MNQISRRILLGTSAATLAAVLAACTTGPTDPVAPEPDATTSVTPGAAGEFPRTITHQYGETVIEAQPERVASVSWVNQDVALALGVVPVAMAAVEYGANENGSTDWMDAKLAELGADLPTTYSEADGINFTGVAAATPDLIIAAFSGITQEDYDKLSKIAPVVAPPEGALAFGTSWQDSTRLIGEALGLEDRAAEVVADVEAAVAEAAEQYPEIQGKTYLYGSVDPAAAEQIYLYTDVDNRPRFLNSLGMVQAPVVVENATAEDGFYITWSPERADELVSDVLVTWAMDESVGEAIKADPLLSSIPAVANDALVLQTDNHLVLSVSAASPLSIPWALENVLPAIAEAAEGAGR
ncbi:ABC transporter substrate-binding protein [Tessaracoccus rhinocerotis]|uniref:ABC transporter substrate-binding protein n=1 Tax=Tessaracoccus rhinocerotis TaxID=1689449 RepID=A0A553JZ93_9ACTN|nr:ABC transporter substrate-binding protein [Tessaracoccus rhinocerotis]TRY17782.1 ABC transporter substrate-binding protein [Tessaracoccus rhinocerotis]